MTKFSKFKFAAAVTVAALAMAAVSQHAIARAKYDGVWSVVIITDNGTCDRAYRYSLRVDNGQIRYEREPGGLEINFGGKIDNNGRVQVNLSRGEQKATGTGRVAEDRGDGEWSGQSSDTKCSGRWEAERRQM